MTKTNAIEFPKANKTMHGPVICSKCEKDIFIPAVKLNIVPDPKGIIGQAGLEVMQVFVCMDCGTVWQGPK